MPIDQLIFTDLARGKGVDPNLKGYQVKACSPSLSIAERELVGAIALHFRTSVYENAPKVAHDREQAWRVQTETLEGVPEEVLQEFPHVWSYAQLGDERFALTRVRYLGFTHDQRPGNFFAHTLVFEPDCLASQHSNPLALCGSNLFLSNDTSDRIQLDVITDLGKSEKVADLGLLRAEPYRGFLAAMVHALASAPISGKSVLICLDDWQKAPRLVEALLALLPPAARCRTTFCTLENDRRWAGAQPSGSPGGGQSAAHHLIVLCSKDGRSLELWPNEYEKTFAVFNFAENKTSPLATPSAYARFAVLCAASEAGMERLQQHHELVRRLGCDQNREAWDALVAAVGLPSVLPSDVMNAVRALCIVAKRPEQAQAGLELLLPSLLGLAQSGKAEGLNELTIELGPLVDRAPAECGFIRQVSGAAGKAFGEGRGGVAASLLRACGRHRDDALKTIITIAVQAVSTSEEDRSAIVDLLLDGMRLVPPERLALLALFGAAQAAGRTSEVWKIVGESAVKSHLSADMRPDDKIQFLRDLTDRVPSTLAPDASVWLRIQLVEAANPKGETLLRELEALAAASAGCADADKVGEMILARIGRLEGQECAIALGRLAESARATPLAEKLFAKYRDCLKELPGKQQSDTRRQLAANGVLKILCREFLADVLQEDIEIGRERLNSWRDRVLNNSDKLLDEARTQVAEHLLAGEKAIWVAEELLSGSRTGRGFVSLFESVVLALPMEALPQPWRNKLIPGPEKMAETARSRLQVLEFLRRLDNSCSEDDWSIEKFPSTNPPRKEAHLLEPDDRRKLSDLCIDSIAETGITTPDQVRTFIGLLDLAADQGAETVADSVERLLGDRDDVTRVQVAAAFAQLALDGDKQQKWGQMVGAIVRRFDRDARRLFESHLEHRFHKRSQKYDERLRHLCESAGLAAPAPSAPSTPGRQEGSLPGENSGGMFGKVGSALRKLMGDSGSGQTSGKK